MDRGAACNRCHLLDGGYALSAAIVCLSLRGGGRFEAVRDVQDHGTPAAEGNHKSGDDRDVARGALSRLGRTLVFGRLVSWKTALGGAFIGRPRFLCSLREGFRRRPESPKSKILSCYQ